jgi:hypothetical protein
MWHAVDHNQSTTSPHGPHAQQPKNSYMHADVAGAPPGTLAHGTGASTPSQAAEQPAHGARLTTGIIGRSPLQLPPGHAFALAPAAGAPAPPAAQQAAPYALTTPRATIPVFGRAGGPAASAEGPAGATDASGGSKALSSPSASDAYPATEPPGIPSPLRT